MDVCMGLGCPGASVPPTPRRKLSDTYQVGPRVSVIRPSMRSCEIRSGLEGRCNRSSRKRLRQSQNHSGPGRFGPRILVLDPRNSQVFLPAKITSIQGFRIKRARSTGGL